MPMDSKDVRNNGTMPQLDNAETPEDLEKALSDEKKKCAEYLASWQRAQADFVNFKRRTEQERQDFNNYANANLILGILPVLDDLEMALKAVPPQYAGDDWVEGVRLIERKFRTSLEGQGVKPIKALGEHFDPHLHEALRQTRGKEGIILEEFQKGYMLHDKLLRPARVVVGTGEEDIKEEE
ncbi:MAG: nucleotide exchange factor GrpE [Chloroflexi bacterium RBG_16_56_11]|nr:MAG: nucleotide exchange factor GrpE [Chloroflexi bacterium RBG_16_56_11]